MLEFVLREIEEAHLIDSPVERIKISTCAVRGAPVAVTFIRAHDEGDTEQRELVIHPEDWRDLLVERPVSSMQRFAMTNAPSTAVSAVYGLPVVYGAGLASRL